MANINPASIFRQNIYVKTTRSTDIRILFYNANRTPKNTSHILQEHRNHYDVVCIQEPWYGPIKNIPSAGGKSNSTGPGDRTEDDKYFGTQSDPDWYLLEHASLKREKTAIPRVVCYVNKRLANARATIHPGILHLDAMLIQLELSHDNTVYILNIYNDSKDNSKLLDVLVERITYHEKELPDTIHCFGGDFNLHSTEWDPSYGNTSPLSTLTKLYFILGFWGLRLLSPPDVPTHLPHNTLLRGSVIDLVWVPDDIPSNHYCIDVDVFARAGSDHALISTLIPVPNFSFLAAPRVSNDSLPEFLESLCTNLSPIFSANTDFSNPAVVTSHVTHIYETITNTWNEYARPHKYSPRSKPWWNQELSESKQSLSKILADSTPPWQRKNTRRHIPPNIRYSPEYMNQFLHMCRNDERRAFENAARLRHKARADFFSLMKRTKNKFFEERIYEIAVNSKRVWDLMPWIRTRAIPDYLGLKSSSGTPITSRDEMWQSFNSTFHAAQDRVVDMSIIEVLPKLETRDWNPFSEQELIDALAMCAAKSAPGWDHMSWTFLKHLTSPKKNNKHYRACIKGFLDLFNACFSLGLWPDEFR